MRLIIIMMCLLFLLFAPACAAPAPPPPWAAPDRELIFSFPGQKDYFIASSVRVYPEVEGCVVETVREFDSGDGSHVKYITETVQISPFVGWIRITSTKAYDTKGNLLYTLPARNWELPDVGIYGNLLSTICDYIVKNQTRLLVESHLTVFDTWYTKALTTSSGDTYYYHPGTIVPFDNYIHLKVRVEYGRVKNGAKSLTQTLIIDVVKRKYYPVPAEKSFNINDLKTRPFSEAIPDGFTIRPGTDMGDFLLNLLEYCRQHYLAVPIPFAQSIPRLLPFPAPGSDDVYFDPDSILVQDGCLRVVMVHRFHTGYMTSLQVFRLRDKKFNCAGIREYDLAGKEQVRKCYYYGLQEQDWKAIEPASLHESFFNTVFAYCRENGISLDP